MIEARTGPLKLCQCCIQHRITTGVLSIDVAHEGAFRVADGTSNACKVIRGSLASVKPRVPTLVGTSSVVRLTISARELGLLCET